jgi:CBS domain-containing protein
VTDQDRTYRVSDIMRTEVVSAAPNDSVGRVARLMVEQGLPGIPVVDDGEIIGIISEGDLVERDAEVTVPSFFAFFDAVIAVDAGQDFDDELRTVLATTAEEMMSSPVYNILPTATITELATLMIQENVNPVPVVNDDLELIGLVSRADVVRLIAKLETAPVTGAAPQEPTAP